MTVPSFNNIFSDKHINKNASKNNFVVYIIGRLAYPISFIFSKIGLTPNQVTTLSTFFAILSSLALVYDNGYLLFLLFWSISALLDFCDGTLARMTNKVRVTSFRYDHTSDLFKIFVVILGVSIRFNDTLLWIVSMSAIFLFMFYGVLSYELGYAKSRHNLDVDTKVIEKEHIANKFNFIKNLYFVNFTIKGHTVFLFLLFSLGKNASIIFLIYFSVLSVLSVVTNIVGLSRLKKIN